MEQHPTTITAALIGQARTRAGCPAFTTYDGEGGLHCMTYGELLDRSLRVASALQDRGLRQGDRLLICLPTGPEVLLAIYGTLLAGGVCVPVYPPTANRGLRRWKERMAAVAQVAQPCGAVVATAGSASRLHMASVLELVAPDLFTVGFEALERERYTAPAVTTPERDLAFVQFTSGTTQRPRGVSITHSGLMANIRALLEVMPLTEGDVSVSWLPPYHDMGLVGHIFVPVHCGVHQHLLPPRVLQRRPRRWLQLISATHATQTTAPNFAYSVCARRISRPERAALDLGALRWALNGAEMVHVETLRAFSDTFGACGFDPEAFRPVYGLAEATLTATFSPRGGATVDWIDRERFATDGVARPARGVDAMPIVSVGCPIPGHELKIVSPTTGRRRASGEVGEVCLRGPSLMQGYFNNPQATAEVLRGGWLHTADLGYLHEDGMLYITGRTKDLIIKGGRNYLPQDFETACLDIRGLRPGRTVAFGLANKSSGTEDIVVVAEVRDPARTRDPVLLQRVVRTVAERTGVRPDRVELASPGVLPKTTSGKLQRGRVKSAFETGTQRPLRSPPRNWVDGVLESVHSGLNFVLSKINRRLGWQ